MDYLALRVADLPDPYVPSEKKECGHCHQPVWVSKAAYTATPSLPIICTRCADLEGQIGVRTEDQEKSKVIHIARDVVNSDRPGDFVRFLFSSFLHADREHFELLRPIVQKVIAEYGYNCTCPGAAA